MLLPVPTKVPPQELVYHLALAPVPKLPPDTVKVVELLGHIAVVPEIVVGATERLLTVNTAAFVYIGVLLGLSRKTAR